ncbi:MAG: CvpA family protein [Dehalococcoidia bacterium]|nr:CvpA family protein [Dehalococcoidia bacterium]
MNWVDLLIVGILAWTTLRAFSNGLIREAIGLLSLIAGVLLTGMYYDDLSANIEFLVPDANARRLAAFAAIFLGVAIAGQVLALVMRSVAAMLMLGPIDRIGGALLGLAKGVLLVEVALVAVAVFPAHTAVARAVAESKAAPVFLRYLPVAQFGLPAEFRDPLGQLQHWQQLLGAAAAPAGAPTPKP